MSGLSHCAAHEAERQAKLKARRARAQTSAAAVLARVLYGDPKWKAARLTFLRQHPLCADCGELGVIEAATDVDHITPHKGDRKLFWD
ncbi:HNH endonuclease [Phaeobacter sp. B1627]|uniref:HNH endonuclease n=1 Tax=Phaeobacter sp. B1627 TaxID=2583809 RepID=UPI00159ED9AB|nr:HNH endonuclease [Phaeobacter sp. B1627]